MTWRNKQGRVFSSSLYKTGHWHSQKPEIQWGDGWDLPRFDAGFFFLNTFGCLYYFNMSEYGKEQVYIPRKSGVSLNTILRSNPSQRSTRCRITTSCYSSECGFIWELLFIQPNHSYVPANSSANYNPGATQHRVYGVLRACYQ